MFRNDWRLINNELERKKKSLKRRYVMFRHIYDRLIDDLMGSMIIFI